MSQTTMRRSPWGVLRTGGLAFLVVAAIQAAAATQSPPAKSDQEILIQLERDWDAAFHRRDVRFIETILADEFIATYSDGSRGDRAEELKRTADFNQQIDSSRLDEFTVRIYGDTAIVWMSQHLVGPSQGKPLAVTFRYVDVWVLRDGRWQCVASQSTRVAN
jgi:ketosteroid isomerase-like protein